MCDMDFQIFQIYWAMGKNQKVGFIKVGEKSLTSEVLVFDTAVCVCTTYYNLRIQCDLRYSALPPL